MRVVIMRMFGVEEFMIVIVAVGVGAGSMRVGVDMVMGVLVGVGDDFAA